ncbi:MAG: hypothetical protein ACOCU2_02200 [Bacillota bacterium]
MYKREVKKLMTTYKTSALIKSLLFSVLISLLIIAPFVAISINLLLLYIRYAYLYLVIIALLFSSFSVLISYFFYQTIMTYPRQDSQDVNMRYLFKIDSIVSSSLIFIISIILILMIAPTYIS